MTDELVRLGMLRELGDGGRLDLPDLTIEHFGARRGAANEQPSTAAQRP